MPLVLAALLGCKDPADPPPLPGPDDLPRWSTAPWIRWAGLADPLHGPLLVVVDQPGGPLDSTLADPDLTTFVNDRFTPLFLVPAAAPALPSPSVQVLDARGCWWLPPQGPTDAAQLIALLNGVMRAEAAGQTAQARPSPPREWGLSLPAGHPLQTACPSP